MVGRIKEYAMSCQTPLQFGPTTEDVVVSCEQQLGFQLPGLLKACYVEVGNGGFGPGYGIIGVESGYASDHGDLIQTYNLFQRSEETEGKKWRDGMLPFCEWGCNIYTCVDCKDETSLVYKYEDGSLSSHYFTLKDFFELWMNGADILSLEGKAHATLNKEITNPFTQQKRNIFRNEDDEKAS